MRFVSRKTNGYKVYAASGTNSVSFAIGFDDANTKDLLGFAVERHDITENERFFMQGFKVFAEVIPAPNQNTVVSTYDHPIQSFVWDDFTGKPDHSYEYFFYPVKGTPRNLDHSESPIKIAVQTEPLHSKTDKHDVFFNRGVASSQAFARRFHNTSPDKAADPKEAQAIFAWLARDLEPALRDFIGQAQKGDSLLACMYEFHYQPIVDAFKQAIDRGVQVKIIIDAKNNSAKFPRDDNLEAIKKAGIGAEHIILREANQNDIQHNKFIVFLPGASQQPTAVWTGSTNVSEGGIFGQTNVGHWVRDGATAGHYLRYWQLLSQDPGAQPASDRAQKVQDNTTFKQAVVALQQDIESGALQKIPEGITPIFSPRTSVTMLNTYAALLDSAKTYAAITLAFGISDVFKAALKDNNANGPITFMLLEKKDAPRPGQAETFLKLTAKNNVYEAWGSYITDPLYQWTKEVNTKLLQLNQHVMYIHSKFMLVDPLGEEPVVVSGSANFSAASTTGNDENMLVIKGDKRAADIYFTEFNRLFNHYYFRSVYEEHEAKSGAKSASADAAASLFLAPNDSWLEKYQPGKLRYKRVKMFEVLQPDKP
ncbi:MAG TPA: phospholipase D-like domain-containing protein [Candidatus Saccharimonadales bacterium]|nr:phospholipase D-like domain-containing protein [Candidatus Saccharimonadales bacterium]